jgi:ABC-type transport system substrate-binding protein
MKKNKSTKQFAAILFTLTLILSACSGGIDGSKKSSDSDDQSLVVAVTGNPNTLDPHDATDTGSYQVIPHILETLVNLNDDLELEQGLAEDWEVTEDGKKWTFKLHKDIEFQDGAPFDAEAVKKSFERVAKQGNNLANYNFVGESIDSMKVKNKDEIVFNLKKPSSDFLTELAMPYSGIISPKQIEESSNEIKKNPIGTGVYKLKKWVSGDSVELEKNPNYWRDTDAPETLTFKMVQENSSRVTMLDTGEVDVIEKVPDTDIDVLEQNENLTVSAVPRNRVAYLGINTSRAPFDDKRVRQALNYAIDTKDIADNVYDGRLDEATSIIQKDTFGYKKVEGYDYNLEKAKDLLKEAGVKKGTKLRIILSDNAIGDKPAAESAQNMLSKLDVFDVELQEQELGTYLDTLDNPDKYELFVRGSFTASGEPSRIFKTFLSGNPQNFEHYSTDQADKLLKTAFSEVDDNKRSEDFGKLQDIWNEAAIFIPIVEDKLYVGYKKDIKGIQFKPYLEFNNVTIE